MDIEYFIHKLSNKMSLIDMGITRLKKSITPEQEAHFEKLKKANDEALELLKEYKKEISE